MSAAITSSLSWWLWSGKHKDPRRKKSDGDSSLSSSPDVAIKFSLAKEDKIASSSSRKIRRKWHSREERKIDREYDVVIVPSDGGCISGSESDGSDWSIGWLEPHGPGFPSDDETENSFAVLVPCYGRGGRHNVVENSQNRTFNTMNFPAENQMEQWLSSLQNS